MKLNKNTQQQLNSSVKKRWVVGANDLLVILEFLSNKTELSKTLIKKIMQFGGVWATPSVNNNQGQRRRVRRVQYELQRGYEIELYYDPHLFEQPQIAVDVVKDFGEFALINKPPNVLSQGNDFGDEGSVLREMEKLKRKSFLVHRLDREVGGLMLMAFTHKSCARLSEMFQKKIVKKKYQAIVKGNLGEVGSELEINQEIDGKNALSKLKVIKSKDSASWVEIEIFTGRKHQIRIHLNSIHHPVLGDPKYGKDNKNKTGLKLWATYLSFPHPFKKEVITQTLQPPENWLSEWNQL